jgi:hypothetical protein
MNVDEGGDEAERERKLQVFVLIPDGHGTHG